MNLLCPQCCSEDVGPPDRGAGLLCRNCGAAFERDRALVSLAEAEAELRPAPPRDAPFSLDRERATAELRDPTGAIAVVSPFSDADELNGLADDALDAGIITAAVSKARLYVYPMSLCEPEPQLAVDSGSGRPALLGDSLALRLREDEDPVDFTLRLLEQMVAEANRLVATYHGDSARLDRIAAFMNHHRSWNGGDVCELVAMELRQSGRAVIDDAPQTEPTRVQDKRSLASDDEAER